MGMGKCGRNFGGQPIVGGQINMAGPNGIWTRRTAGPKGTFAYSSDWLYKRWAKLRPSHILLFCVLDQNQPSTQSNPLGTIENMLKLVCILAFLALAHSAVIPPLDLNSIPEEYRDLVPPEVTTFYNELTEEDKQILKEIAGRHEEFQNEDQALEALKAKSEKLYNKAVELRNLVKGKIDALNPEAKEFVTGVIDKLKALRPKPGEKPNLEELRKAANEIIEKYKGLNDEAKESLKTNFPKITGIVSNEKFQNLAKSLLKPEGAAPAA